MGGQLPNRLALSLHESGVKLLVTALTRSTKAETDKNSPTSSIALASINRAGFLLGQKRNWKVFTDVSFPVLVRPVLFFPAQQWKSPTTTPSLWRYIDAATALNREHQWLFRSSSLAHAKLNSTVSRKMAKFIFAIVAEHVENAGVHWAMQTVVVPGRNFTSKRSDAYAK